VSQGHLVAVGASFKTAPLALRERLAIDANATPEMLRYLREYAAEALILSTCNRSEIYLVTSNVAQGLYGARSLFAARSGLPPDELENFTYQLTDEAAAAHLLEVAAGMDSLVPGEHEIQTQVRLACQMAQAAKALGPVLSRLSQTALHTGKRARSETAVGRHAASVSLAAVRLAQEVLGSLQGRNVLILGAGKTANLVAQALRGQRANQVAIASRSLGKALALADQVGGLAREMSALPLLLSEADVIFSCTSATEIVLTAASVAESRMAGRGNPLLLVDLAVPRDIDPQVRDVPNVALYDLDDLRAICERNQAARRQALAQVGAIVKEEAEQFRAWWRARDATPSVALLRTWAEEVRQAELAKTTGKLSHLSDEDLGALEALTQALVSKLLHRPTMYLKSRDGLQSAQAVHDVFGITLPEGASFGEMEAFAFRSERGNDA